MIENSFYYQAYIDSCVAIKPYCKRKERVPESLANAHSHALINYRKYLDLNGFKMPKQRYPYIESDMSTWRYLTPIKGLKFGYDKPQLNQSWKYKTGELL